MVACTQKGKHGNNDPSTGQGTRVRDMGGKPIIGPHELFRGEETQQQNEPKFLRPL